MHESEFKYKSETGNTPFLKIDSVLMTKNLDTYPLQECDTAEEVIEIINLCDNKRTIPIESIPKQYLDGSNLKIYSPEYVGWLQEKINQ